MKRNTLLLILFVFSLSVNAQKTEKGIWQIEIGTGIQAGFNFVTDGNYENTITSNGAVISESEGDWSDFYNTQTNLSYGFDFTNFNNWEDRFLKDLSFGYFVADNFLIGLGLNLGGINTNDDDTLSISKLDNLAIGAIPKIRYYIETGRGNALFIESSLGFNLSTTNSRYDNVITDDWNESLSSEIGTTFGVAFGWSIFNFNSREIFSIEPIIGLNINTGTTKQTLTTYTKIGDLKIIDENIVNGTSMEPYIKLKLAFYLGRHFWSH